MDGFEKDLRGLGSGENRKEQGMGFGQYHA